MSGRGFFSQGRKGLAMDEHGAELSTDQLRAIGAMSGADAAGLDGQDAEAVVEWLAGDAGFVARLNRAKT
jgi:hypothetical protein